MKKVNLMAIAMLSLFTMVACEKEDDSQTASTEATEIIRVTGYATHGSHGLTNANIVVTDGDGTPITLDILDELIEECLIDFWKIYDGGQSTTSKSANIANGELTITDENGNVLDVDSFAMAQPVLLNRVKSLIYNAGMSWVEHAAQVAE